MNTCEICDTYCETQTIEHYPYSDVCKDCDLELWEYSSAHPDSCEYGTHEPPRNEQSFHRRLVEPLPLHRHLEETSNE